MGQQQIGTRYAIYVGSDNEAFDHGDVGIAWQETSGRYWRFAPGHESENLDERAAMVPLHALSFDTAAALARAARS